MAQDLLLLSLSLCGSEFIQQDMITKRLVRNIFLIVGGFVLLLVILAEIFKNDIVKLAVKKGAKTFDVPLGVGEVDFSLIYRFPLATIEFNDLVMLSGEMQDSSKLPIDTIAGISKLYASVDILELIKGNILVKEVEIEDVKAKYIVDSLGNSNFDFLIKGGEPDTVKVVKDTSKIQGVYTLDELALSNIELHYIDSSLNTSAQVFIPELEMNGEVEATGFKAATDGEVIVKTARYEDYNLEVLNESKLNFNVTVLNDTINITNFDLNTGTALLNVTGNMVSADSSYVDVQFKGSNIDIGKNLSILPPKLITDYKIKKATGICSLDGTAKGFITNTALPQLNVNVGLTNGVVKYDTYPEVNDINLNANFSNGYATTLQSIIVNIKRLAAKTDKSSVEVSARIQNPEHLQYDLSAKITTHLEEFKPFVPDSLVKQMKGSLSANITTAGILPDSITDAFTDYLLSRTKLNLAWNNINIEMDSIPSIKDLGGKLSYQPNRIKLSDFKIAVPDYKVNVVDGYINAGFKGKVANYEELSLQIDSLMLATPQSAVSAKGKVDGLKDIDYSLQTSIKLGLSEVIKMLPDSLANYMSGKVEANILSKGAFHIDSVADKAMSLMFENSSLAVNMDHVTLEMPDSLMNVSNLSGQISYKDDTIRINNTKGNYLGLDFSADSTTVASVYTAAVQNNKKELRVHGNFGAGDLDYAWIEAFMIDTVPLPEEEMQAKIQAKLEEEPYVQNFTVKANGKVKLKSFKYGDILAENIDSKFLAKVDEGYYVADQLTCNVFGGDVKGSMMYQIAGNYIDVLQFRTDAKDVNMSRMLDELESFIDYEDFSKEKVKGNLTSKMDGRVVLKDYEVIYDSLMLTGNLTLTDGALVKVKPVMEIEKIPMIGLKGLSNLRFSKLESSLFIYNNKVYIPQTLIKTTSFDASFLGMYGFDEQYAYHVRMFLGEILAGKSKYNLKKQTKDMGFVEESEEVAKKGRTALYLISSFDGKKERAWWDKKSDRDRMKTLVRMNGRGLRILFKPTVVKYETGVK